MLVFGRFEVQPERRRLLQDGNPVAIGARAFDVLLALAEGRDRILTKAELLDIVWPGLIVEENNLQVQISALRKLLGPGVISTIPGRGYQFVAEGEQRSHRPATHNLPAERDPFVGRVAELRALTARVEAGRRFLTVLGPGGVGKTRFLCRYARDTTGEWPGGVYFCDLSDVRSIDGLLGAVASALEVPLGAEKPHLQLGTAIAARGRCLVALDNFEQVAEHAGATIGRWLDATTEAVFVTTSRERLHIAGEELFPLEPLPIQKDAVDLFVTRACSHKPDFVLDDGTRDSVAEIVRLVDGLPLAIELAAARIRTLSPTQLVERMHDRFALLVDARGVTPRRATLRTAIDWSWNLLLPWEQAAFAQCSVFAGGFTLKGAEAVLELSGFGAAPAGIDAIQALIDKSLLRTWVPVTQSGYCDSQLRFGMYMSIHEYAAEKLRACSTDTEQSVERRHAHYFSHFGTDDALESLFQHGGVQKRRALALELDNLVSACRWATDQHEGRVAVATYRAAWEVLKLSGPFAFGVALGAPLQELASLDSTQRALVEGTVARALQRMGRPDEAQTLLRHALTFVRETASRRLEGKLLKSVGDIDLDQGRKADAQERFEVALAIAREVVDRPEEAMVLASLGTLCGTNGLVGEALKHLEASLALARDVGNRNLEGVILSNLGWLHDNDGRREQAREHVEAALAIYQEVGDRRLEGYTIARLGTALGEQGDKVSAKSHYAAALAIARELGDHRLEGYVFADLGTLQYDQGHIKDARTSFESAIAVARDLHDPQLESIVLCEMGAILLKESMLPEARSHFEAALQLAREGRDPRIEGAALGGLAALQAKQGQIVEALDTLRKGELVLRAAVDRRRLAELLCVRGQVEVLAGKRDCACAALGEAESIAAAIGSVADTSIGRGIMALRGALV